MDRRRQRSSVAEDLANDWDDPQPMHLPAGYLEGAPRLLREVLWRRGYQTDGAARAFLNPREYRLPDRVFDPHLQHAVDRLLEARDRGEQVAIWGDYDADGQAATAILQSTLSDLGFSVRSYHLSCTAMKRGITTETLQEAAAAGVGVVVTCDFGTNDHEACAAATALGMDMIVTDHHQQVGPLPDAVCVLNSNHVLPDDPVWGLSGSGVAFLLARALLRQIGQASQANALLDLVTIGSVTDMAPLTPAYRAMLHRGVARLWEHPRPGVRALLQAARRHPVSYDTGPISFLIGPVLNACGRLGSPADGVLLLLERDIGRARHLASRLLTLRDGRNRLVASITAQIAAQIGGELAAGALIAVGSDWHPGVLGRLAGDLARRFARPAVVISGWPQGGMLRGSARAEAPVDLMAVLAGCADDLETYGGHAHAAGFAVRADRLDSLRSRLVHALSEAAARAQHRPVLQLDGEEGWRSTPQGTTDGPPLEDWVHELAPFCAGNPELVLMARDVHVIGSRTFGNEDRHQRILFMDACGCRRELTWWNGAPASLPRGPLDVAYTVALDEWRGTTALQYILRGARPHQQTDTG
jgi:single-stranded-DNA-specific exonuclease